MKSFIATAALGAALLSQATMAATLGHAHAHHHTHAATRRAANSAHTARSTDGTAFIDAAGLALIESLGILTGANVANNSGTDTAVTVGAYGGAYVVEFNNVLDEDLVLVIWDSATKAWVNVDQPAITKTIKANHTAHISFDPSVNADGSISGAWAAVYSNTTLYDGLISNTWGEYTFDGEYSTIDISREVYMDGNSMEILNYASRSDAEDDSSDPACTANMVTCAYVCTNGETTCGDAGTYEIIGCDAGTADTTTDASATDGGCAGIADGGYIVVNLA